MRHENSNGHLVTGLLFGALVGACATYLIVKNKDSIRKCWEEMNEKVKDGMHQFADKAKEKADELTQKAKEKMHAAEEAAECLGEKLHHATPHRNTSSKK